MAPIAKSGFWRFDALFGLAFTVAIAYGCDYWIQRLREAASGSFDIRRYHLGVASANFVLAMLLMTLVWLVHLRTSRSVLVAWVYSLVGLCLSLLPLALAQAPSAFSFLFAPALRGLRVTLLYSRPQSLLIFCGAVILVIGLVGILPVNRNLLEKILGPF
jgi:hypothetical protein